MLSRARVDSFLQLEENVPKVILHFLYDRNGIYARNEYLVHLQAYHVENLDVVPGLFLLLEREVLNLVPLVIVEVNTCSFPVRVRDN